MARATVVAVLALGALLAPISPVSPAQAYNPSAFNPGNIIDDALFYDGVAMSAAQIQDFLDERVARCTIGDHGRAAGSVYGSSRVASTCLKNFTVTTASRASNAYCATYSGAVNESAAQIIAKVGKACGISPKVLLVMLEKEQSLITDTWPLVRQFDVAMGYACPDSGPGGSANCDPSQTGFYQQVYRAAWQYRVYRANPAGYNYRAGQWNTIQWSVPLSCGTSRVFIENMATAALYIYTPYRPNQAALAAGWGTGDECSTYGNRNFLNFYRSWFGTPHPSAVTGAVHSSELVPVPGGVNVRGYVGDAGGPARNVQIYMGNGGWQASANVSRSDGKAGFHATVPGTFSGTQRLCAYSAAELGCKDIDFGVSAPYGDLNSAGVVGRELLVRGWGVDPDALGGPLEVHVYVGSQGFRTQAVTSRPDVQQVYPQYGSNRGYEGRIDATRWAGTTQLICAYGINVTPGGYKHGSNPLLGTCKSVTFPAEVVNRAPIGALDAVTVEGETMTVTGWAFDPDFSGPIDAHVYVGAKSWAVRADQPRPDVSSAHGLADDKHGFVWTMPVTQDWENPTQVCVYGINVNKSGAKDGTHPKLGCIGSAWIVSGMNQAR